jgi:hypothetical protein
MRAVMWLVLVPASMALWSCAPKTATVAGPAQSAALPTVVAAEAALAASGKIVLAYTTLPVCVGQQTAGCHDPVVASHVRQVYDQAYTDVTQAQAIADAGGTPSTVIMTASLQALQQLAAVLPQPAQ